MPSAYGIVDHMCSFCFRRLSSIHGINSSTINDAFRQVLNDYPLQIMFMHLNAFCTWEYTQASRVYPLGDYISLIDLDTRLFTWHGWFGPYPPTLTFKRSYDLLVHSFIHKVTLCHRDYDHMPAHLCMMHASQTDRDDWFIWLSYALHCFSSTYQTCILCKVYPPL